MNESKLVDELLMLMRKVSLFTEEVARQKQEHVQSKQDYSPVTIADYGAQILVGYWLSQNYSGDALIAEESSKALLESGEQNFLENLYQLLSLYENNLKKEHILQYLDFNSDITNPKSFWVLDPLDGTKGFLRGDQYAISLAYIKDRVLELGVLACPRLRLPNIIKTDTAGCVFFAQKGRGAWVTSLVDKAEWFPIHVSECTRFEDARLLRSYESKHTNLRDTEQFLLKSRITKSVPIDSQVKYGLLASGEGEIILRFPPEENPEYREKIWDHAGGAIVLEEAGGKVTDVRGASFQFNGDPLLKNSIGVFASNGYLHHLGLEILKEILQHERKG
ncbi:MAG TPA: inositol monophosphatase family protein [Candidatus Hydrogenedens sp.]|nr:3'(2'),5'-bisphosphate nucleotidase [Candidatus Hydrogenedens sp.]HOK10358.1 inositol monophosphatase family protein [Candidatus Hydrogenedens sp.]HOL20683.1 inositol monophosphatase family protein [Candidatus Hydrogenedens sp.]HPP59857.1 inositol monophosphatase family protein [Candidatus Hydrogenedens sp.]